LRFSLLREAINSTHYERYHDIISKDFGISDKRFELFEKRIEFDTREAIERILSICMVIADGNYAVYTENKAQPVVINELKRIIHLSTGRNHEVKIALDTHRLDIGRKILASKENDLTIAIQDGAISHIFLCTFKCAFLVF
jgi:hypothetical protein